MSLVDLAATTTKKSNWILTAQHVKSYIPSLRLNVHLERVVGSQVPLFSLRDLGNGRSPRLSKGHGRAGLSKGRSG